MKKLLIAACMMLGFANFTNAQTAVATQPAPAKVVKMNKAKPAATTATGLKADGTPDMRLKANKTKAAATPVAGPTKKDGTADMRYKANKKKG